ncbi:uncharacterized protein LOC129182891 [Dunckerocampus dactyliophorus]|uniref:uncharacterized protein LOC129182891 n=1 Tax=Dunckerocampus dactyliophorus TaxID=161453 RepID=UPI002404CB57|nr:uncharacterized protein LOC129182891 [Dunckerocampus dactyliophorus]XP_054635509.1 uncharacterized protein LOC129182891 [Dunckerocampus dactyliophorus]
MDIECPEKRFRGRGQCMDACVVVSILVLYAAFTGCVMVLMGLRSKMDSSPQHFPIDPTGLTPNPAYKMQNFAFLEAVSSKLVNSTMQWAPVPYGAGKSVGSNFQFDENQHFLRPQRGGTYFMYLDLNVTCTCAFGCSCSAGRLSVQVGDMLSCQVELPEGSMPESKRCWTVSWMDSNTQLLTHMSVPKEGLKDWKLGLSGSNLGMFLVD